VAEIRDPKNYEITKIVGKDEVEIVLVGDLISRIIAQTCRQPGLSCVVAAAAYFGILLATMTQAISRITAEAPRIMNAVIISA
jgi:hypothetical protein